jgi:outer membrane usher protein
MEHHLSNILLLYINYLEPDEQLYLFTDLDGRFILSDVSPGTYLFDMSAGNNQWYGLYFTVPETAQKNQNVLLLQDYQQAQQSEDVSNAFDVVADQNADTVSTFGDELASDYLEIIELPFDRYEDEQVFWDTIFPPLDEEATDLAFEDTASDWQNTLDDTQTMDQASFENDPAFADTAENWEENLDENYIPTVVESTNSTNPNYTYVP